MSLVATITKLECALEALECVTLDKGGRPPSQRGRVGAHQHVRVWAPRSGSTEVRPDHVTLTDSVAIEGEWSQNSDPQKQKASRNAFLEWCEVILEAVLRSNCCSRPTGVQIDRTEDGAWLRLRIILTATRTIQL